MNNHEFIEGTIESLIGSIADGVKEAQDSLNDIPAVDMHGRPTPSYHIPYVDFDIAVNLSMRQTRETEGSSTTLPVLKRLRFSPAKQSQTADISSHVSGRIVSVPPGEGLPIIELMADEDPEKRTARERLIRVLARNSQGELIQGRKVEININWELSASLNSDRPFNRNTVARLENSALITHENGMVETHLHFRNNARVGTVILLDINLGNAMTRLSIIR